MEFIEVSAKTKEEAITKACIDLGVASDSLEYQVISEGSSGFLGIGAKPAVIRARRKEEKVEETPAVSETPAAEAKKAAPEKEAKAAEKAAPEKEAKAAEKAVPEKEAKADEKDAVKPAAKKDADIEKEEVSAAPAEKEEVKPDRSEDEIVEMKASATKFLDSVFQAMDLPVNITVDYEKEADCLNIDFAGKDMGILIGKRGQTLDSLQYLTSLVVNRETKHFVRIKLDTEDYRRRRKETLENLASNIARKVKKTRKAVSLEPMNPYERRIIHSRLQGNRFVETYSEGSEPYRYVVVSPKRYEKSERYDRR